MPAIGDYCQQNQKRYLLVDEDWFELDSEGSKRCPGFVPTAAIVQPLKRGDKIKIVANGGYYKAIAVIQTHPRVEFIDGDIHSIAIVRIVEHIDGADNCMGIEGGVCVINLFEIGDLL